MRSKNNHYFKLLQKVFITRSITILSPSKSPPSDIIHLCQHFFQFSKHFCYALIGIANSSCFDFSFIFSIVAKCFPFIAVFSFGKRKKSLGAKPVEYGGWLKHDYGFVFGQKLTHKHRCVSYCVIMLQIPWLVFPQFCAFLTNCFAQSGHNYKLVFVIDRTTLWQEFMIQHAIVIEENSKENLHI